MNTRTKNKTVSNNENSNGTAVQKIKKSKSKSKSKSIHLNDISNTSDMKDASDKKFELKKSKKMNQTNTLSTSSKRITVGTEEEKDVKETIVKISSNFLDNEAILTKSIKLEMLHNMNNCSVPLKDVMKHQNTKMKTAEPVNKENTETSEATIDFSSNLLDKNEGIPAIKSTSLKFSGHRKSIRFENQNKTQSNSKGHHKDNISNSIDMKDTSDNKFELKKSKKINQTDTRSTSSKWITVGTEKEKGAEETIVDISSNFLDTDDNEAIPTKSAILKLGHRRAKCIVHVSYSLDSSNSNCPYESKLSRVRKSVNYIENCLKRFKPS